MLFTYKIQRIIILSSLFSFAVFVNSVISDSLSPSITWRLPLEVKNRSDFSSIKWEKDAKYMMPRIGGHLHTGIDLMKHNQNIESKIYAASNGCVVSIYATEPNKSLMVKHKLATGKIIYSVYVHITDIQVSVGDMVDANTFIGRLMNTEQLNKYGWEFNHIHFEILKGKPRGEASGKYLSYSVLCKTQKEVDVHFHNPVSFFNKMWEFEKTNK